MGSIYYYAQNGQSIGPVSSRDLRQLAAAGKLRPTDLVWKEGHPDWILAARVKGLAWPARPPAPRARDEVDVEPVDQVEIVGQDAYLLSGPEFDVPDEDDRRPRRR